MRQVNLKKYVLPNLPYLFVGLYATKLGQAWRLSSGMEFADKVLHLMDGFATAFQSAAPSFHPSDLLVGLCCGAGLRLAVYIKGKNAKKYRHGTEYGSARWGTAKDIQPFVDPVFENNAILTQTEQITMNNRPKDPKTARNKNFLTSGTLHQHLAEIDQACNERMEIIVSAMAKQEGVTEALKAADQMEWVRRMNNIRSRAEEIVLTELVYE